MRHAILRRADTLGLPTPARLPVRRAPLLAAGVLAAASLAVPAPATHAAPVFVDAETHLDPFGNASSYSFVGAVTCDATVAGGAEPAVPVLENGPAASITTSASATFSNSGNAGDTGVGASSATASGKVTSVAGNPSTMDLAVTSNAQLTNALGTSPNCAREVSSAIDLVFEFKVTNPGFLQLTTKSTSGATGAISLYGHDASIPDNLYTSHSGSGATFNGSTRVFLPAGSYRGDFTGGSHKSSLSSYSISGTTTVHAEFNVAGSQIEAVSGKGKRYVSFPSARSCATHALVPSITEKKKRAKQVKQVTFFVNDARVKQVQTPDKKDTINVPIADDQTADVLAKVKLFATKRGKPAKVLEVDASYEACS